jgi:hypothetical protein
MRERGEIKAALDRISRYHVADRCLNTGKRLGIRRRFVDRRRHLIAYRCDDFQVDRDCVEVARRENLVEGIRHLRRNSHAAWPYTLG